MKRFLSSIIGSYWMIDKEYGQKYLNIVEDTLKNDMIQFSGHDSIKKVGQGQYQVYGRVAVINIVGPITRWASVFEMMCGGISTETLARLIGQAVADTDVDNIVLEIDSPGGESSGISEVSEIIKQVSQKKPIYAHTSGMMCSAAYLIGSACKEIYVSDMAILGSVGVIITLSKHDNENVTIVSSQSPYKRLDAETKEGASVLQDLADSLANAMIERIAANRNTTTDHVISDFGRGGNLVGIDSVNSGMADKIKTLDNLIEELNTKASKSKEIKISNLKSGRYKLEEETSQSSTIEDFKALIDNLKAQIKQKNELIEAQKLEKDSEDCNTICDAVINLGAFPPETKSKMHEVLMFTRTNKDIFDKFVFILRSPETHLNKEVVSGVKASFNSGFKVGQRVVNPSEQDAIYDEAERFLSATDSGKALLLKSRGKS